jgi:hypothetical protein
MDCQIGSPLCYFTACSPGPGKGWGVLDQHWQWGTDRDACASKAETPTWSRLSPVRVDSGFPAIDPYLDQVNKNPSTIQAQYSQQNAAYQASFPDPSVSRSFPNGNHPTAPRVPTMPTQASPPLPTLLITPA